jgi:hypothetical protein
MKLGVFIALAICTSSAIAIASPSLTDQAAARSRAGDHVQAIELYRQAYEVYSDTSLLVRIAHEHRLAGHAHDALAYFCSYLYINAAGDLADDASTNARAIAGELGNPTDSDRDACETKPNAKAAPRPATKSVDVLASEVIVRPPPRITKREVAGLITMGASVASLGLVLYEAHKIEQITEDMTENRPGTDLDALADRKDSAELRQKLYLGAGGIALITGGILYITGRADRKRAERAYVAPSLTKSGAGLVLGGKF